MITRRRRRATKWILGGACFILSAACVTGCLGPVTRPTADFSVCPDGSEGRLDYWFTSTSMTVPDHWIEETVWEFDDDSPPTASWGEAHHRFAESGTYYVTLTVTDSRGVSGTVTKPVAIEPAAYVHATWSLTLGYPPTVTGIVENRYEETLRSVKVRARFYDVDGIRLTDGRVVIIDLEPGERAAFKIQASEFNSRIFAATVDIESFEVDCARWVGGL